MAEFTGERVIPGEVDVDLFNEHMARYTFAARLARGKRVLDAGCGTGYGSMELAHVGSLVIGTDIAAEAVQFAREHYRTANVHFVQASCGRLPHPNSFFDLVVAFEVIEHLEEWRAFLREVRRVLAPSGQFIVSTPNRLYYAESRGAEGANPFHVHEFEFEEFRSALGEVFPEVELFLENHVEGVMFQPHRRGNTAEVRVDADDAAPQESHFFVAVCADRLQVGNPTFVYIPSAANVLRERERHIALLEQEIEAKNEWLEQSHREHAELLTAHRAQTDELERANQWGQALTRDVGQARARIEELQEELAREQEHAREVAAAYAAKVGELEQDVRSKVEWAREIEGRLNTSVDALSRSESELADRTAWALRLDEEGRRLREQLDLCHGSRWVRLGRKLGVGPGLPAK